MSVNKKFFLGNLDPRVSKEDICHLFGLEATSYLRSSCWVELATDASGKSRGYGFVSVPEHIAQQLVKFNGIDFYGKELKIEPARDKEEKESTDEEQPDTKKKPKPDEKAKKPENNRRGRGRGGRQGQGWNNRNQNYNSNYNNQFVPRGGYRQKYNLPVLAEDQIFPVIDAGVNLTNGRFQNVDYVIARAMAAGIQKMIVTGNRLNPSKAAIVMAKTHPSMIYAAVGIHPHYVKDEFNDKSMETLQEIVKAPEVVCVGEIGLDFNRDFSPREDQKKAFEKQLEIACKANKPILAHDRDSHDSLVEILDKFKTELPTVVIHCFTGNADEIRAYVARGFYIGITGFVCKEKHGKLLRNALESGVLPLDKMVIQSDAPYMIPNMAKADIDPVSESLLDFCIEGHNEPCTLPVIVRCIAKCLKKDPKEVAEVTTATAKTIFNLA